MLDLPKFTSDSPKFTKEMPKFTSDSPKFTKKLPKFTEEEELCFVTKEPSGVSRVAFKQNVIK
jgi:hypothetical protein